MLVTVFIMVLWAIICFQPGETETCDEGFYQYTPNNHITSRCVLCSLCPPGSRVLTRCSNTTDTVCQPCQKGSFSLGWNLGEYCVPCTRCSSHQRRVACSPTSDTVCKPSCTRGYYWDQSALDCLRCSYCPPNTPQERVYECEQNGASKDNLCAEGATLRARMAEYIPPPKSYRQLDRLAEEYPSDNEMRVTSQGGLVIRLSENSDQMMTSPWPVPLMSSQTLHPRPTTDQWTRMRGASGRILSPHLTGKPAPSTSGKPSPQQSSRSLWSQLSATDIVVIVVVITLSGVLSFVITAVTCHFLMKAGVVRPTSATVAVARERPTVKGWTELPRYDTSWRLSLDLSSADQEVI
ncbi:uncharacterized protein [Diadema setosum]|uniref:uncharacterized protein n=1 Tax=Diadema setosum TaxID=31175 RepID=UPI003B3B8141